MLYRSLLIGSIVTGLDACSDCEHDSASLETREQIDTARMSDILKVMATD